MQCRSGAMSQNWLLTPVSLRKLGVAMTVAFTALLLLLRPVQAGSRVCGVLDPGCDIMSIQAVGAATHLGAGMSGYNLVGNAPIQMGAYNGAALCYATNDDGATVSQSNDATAVQQAVSAASPGATVKIAGACAGVQVVDGTAQTVLITQPLTLIGGYASTDWTVSHPITQPTTLDALGGGRVVYAAVDATLQGFTVTHGVSTDGAGGGIKADAALTLTAITVYSNSANTDGGGAYAAGPAVIKDSRFDSNRTTLYDGGGLLAEAALVLTNTQFISNSAANNGGGLRAKASTIVTGATFAGNISLNAGGGALFDGLATVVNSSFTGNGTTAAGSTGGGGYFSLASVLDNVTLSQNNAGTGGGGGAAFITTTMLSGGAMISNTTTGKGGGGWYGQPATITGTTFISNSASDDGGGAWFGATAVLTGATFLGNTTAGGFGGGGACFNQPATLTNATFTGNHSTAKHGGGAYFQQGAVISTASFLSNTSAKRGAGIYVEGVAIVARAAFTGNQASDNGGGAYFRNVADVTGSNFVQNQTTGNAGGAYFFAAATLTDTNFLTNTSAALGGGAYLSVNGAVNGGRFAGNQSLTSAGGGLYGGASVTVSGTHFVGNIAALGGGGLYGQGDASINAASFLGNRAPYGAGWAQQGGTNNRVVNSLFTRNSAALGIGDAIGFLPSGAANLEVLYTTIASPTLSGGSAIAVGGGIVTVTDSILVNHAAAISQTLSSTVYQDYNLFYGNLANTMGTVGGGSHSLVANPAFIDAASDNYDLTPASYAINRAVDVGIYTDHAGDVRPTGGGFDIGFDESPYSTDLAIAKTVAPATVLPGGGVTYTIAYSNSGTGLVSGITISDSVPLSVTVTGVSSSGIAITQTSGSPDFAWIVGDIAAGQRGWITLTGTLDPDAFIVGVTITNTAMITSTGALIPGAHSGSAGFTVGAGTCAATADDGATVYTSANAAAVRAALGHASVGATVKVAGYCAGAVTDGGSTQVALITRTLTLAGGYSPANWVTPAPLAQPTTLDALSGGRVVFATVDATLQDFTVTNGAMAGNGGGVYAVNGVTLTGMNFYSNSVTTDGGGVYVGGAARVVDSTFAANVAGRDGGGLNAVSNLAITTTHFVSNTATVNGGGLRANSAATLTGTTFAGNTAAVAGGALFDSPSTLTNSNFAGNWTGAAGSAGGGYFNGDATQNNVRFELNRSGTTNGGGAVYSNGATLTGVTFVSNTTAAAGGGAYFNGTAALSNTNFTANQATTGRGAGAYFKGGASLSNSSFVSNTAVSNRGGGAYFQSGALLTNTNFLTNTGVTLGGGLYAGGALAVDGGLFQANQCTGVVGASGIGGGIYVSDTLAVNGVQFVNNRATSAGGAVYAQSSTELSATIFLGNQALYGAGWTQEGGTASRVVNSLFARNIAGISQGNAIGWRLPAGGSLELLFNTIANPSIATGSAVDVGDGTGMLAVTDTLFANYETGIVLGAGPEATSDYNLFYEAPTAIVTGSHSLTNTNPLFLDPANDNYRLPLGSPAGGRGINAGVGIDLDGAPRFDPPTIGAYEALPFPILAATKTVEPSTNVAYHGTVTYTITIANSGAVSDTMAILTDTLPTQVTFGRWIEAPAGALNSANAITWTGTLTNGSVLTFTFSVTHTGALADVVTNTAFLSGTVQAVNASATFTTVDHIATTTTLTTPVDTTTFGQLVTFTATVFFAPPAPGGPTGVVTFTDGITFLGTGSVGAGGVAVYTTNSLAPGNHSIQATYGGDASFSSSVSNLVPHTVTQASTTTSLFSAPNPSFYGELVVFTATVTTASPFSPTGIVSITIDGLPHPVALINGVATISEKWLLPGSHPVTAVYGGDTRYLSSASGTLTQVVVSSSTSTTLEASPSPVGIGASTTTTAVVSAPAPIIPVGILAAQPVSPTGTVTFFDGVTSIGQSNLTGAIARLTTSFAASGVHTITAVYSGDANYAASTSAPVTYMVSAPLLTVVTTGNATGTVGSNPAGILCGAQCQAAFQQGVTVTLDAVGSPTARFAGWTGPCAGQTPCALSLQMAETVVTATFTSVISTPIYITGNKVTSSTLLFTTTLPMTSLDTCMVYFGDGAEAPCTVEGAGEGGIIVSAIHAYAIATDYTITFVAVNSAGIYQVSRTFAVTRPTGEEVTPEPDGSRHLYLPYVDTAPVDVRTAAPLNVQVAPPVLYLPYTGR